MDILVCTYGRPGKQITWNNLPYDIRERARLVVQEREAGEHPGLPLLVLPDHIRNISETRQWLVHNQPGDKVAMLDDDLVFARRRCDDPTKFSPASETDLIHLFDLMERCLDKYAHVGVSAREGANRNPEPYLFNTRAMRIHGYRRDILRKEEIHHNRLTDMEDFDVTLQLLRKGYPNLIINHFVHNQNGSGNEGGCSEFRTLESHAENCHTLANELHPGYVSVVQKHTKTSWGGNTTRTDVRISWKAAYNSSPEKKIV
jgi:hypothetical protein